MMISTVNIADDGLWRILWYSGYKWLFSDAQNPLKPRSELK